MVTLLEVIAALLLGFLAGRVWEIRQQIIRDEHLNHAELKAEPSADTEGSKELELNDSYLMESLDHNIRALVMAAVSAQRHPTITVRGLRPMPYRPK
jgi:hypothetical protein